MIRLSAIVITKNEERNIRDCLSGLDWVDEIVVVDAGSEDRTVSIARAFTSRVYRRRWAGFGEAKNFALRKARGEWIFWLDADERSTLQLREEVQRNLSSAPAGVSAYSFPRKANFLGGWILHAGWYPGRVTRLFRKSAARFTEEGVHEQIVVNGTVVPLRADILHFTDPDLFRYFEKFNRYTTLAAGDLSIAGRRFRVHELVMRPLWQFIRMYFLRLGLLDGMRGFILCSVSSGYVFVKYAKLWERERATRLSTK